jgi:aspartate 1-decarboxylase
MLIEVMRSKLHRVTVTDANKDYIGSVTVDATLLDAAHMGDMERVQVLNVTNGARLETYIIVGERNSGVICLNGAAAHHFKAGDTAIIVAYGFIQSPETVASRTVFVDDKNRITGVQVHQFVR